MTSLVVVGLSHRTAPIALREQVAAGESGAAELVGAARQISGVREVAIVATCNRLEIYVVADEPAAAANDLRALLARDREDVTRALYAHTGEAALRHFFRVASALDSMVVGEPQITGQVKDGFRRAREAGASGSQLERVLARALFAAKRVRGETALSEGLVSIASVAVDLTRKIFGDLEGRTGLLVGAGEMGSAAARALKAAGVQRLWVVNRSYERAQALAAKVGGEPAQESALPALIEVADVALCATAAPGFVLGYDLVAAAAKARRYRPLFLLDLALPRDIDPRVNLLENTYLYNIDDLDQVAAAGRNLRADEARKAEALAASEVAAFLRDAQVRAGAKVLAELRARAAEIAKHEAERTLRHAGPLTEEQTASIQAMAQAIVAKLLHAPAQALRAEAEALGEAGPLAEMAARLFALAPDDAQKPTLVPTSPPKKEVA